MSTRFWGLGVWGMSGWTRYQGRIEAVPCKGHQGQPSPLCTNRTMYQRKSMSQKKRMSLTSSMWSWLSWWWWWALRPKSDTLQELAPNPQAPSSKPDHLGNSESFCGTRPSNSCSFPRRCWVASQLPCSSHLAAMEKAGSVRRFRILGLSGSEFTGC